MNIHRTNPLRRQRGLTLIETAVTVAIAAITLGTALPGFVEARARRHLDGAIAQFETDVQYARAEAVARHLTLRIGFAASAAGSCYVIHTGAAQSCRCDAQGQALCEADGEAIRTVSFGAAHPVQLAANVRSMAFDADRGTVTPTASVQWRSDHGSLRAIVNVMGRVRTCAAAPGVPGYRDC